MTYYCEGDLARIPQPIFLQHKSGERNLRGDIQERNCAEEQQHLPVADASRKGPPVVQRTRIQERAPAEEMRYKSSRLPRLLANVCDLALPPHPDHRSPTR